MGISENFRERHICGRRTHLAPKNSKFSFVCPPPLPRLYVTISFHLSFSDTDLKHLPGPFDHFRAANSSLPVTSELCASVKKSSLQKSINFISLFFSLFLSSRQYYRVTFIIFNKNLLFSEEPHLLHLLHPFIYFYFWFLDLSYFFPLSFFLFKSVLPKSYINQFSRSLSFTQIRRFDRSCQR